MRHEAGECDTLSRRPQAAGLIRSSSSVVLLDMVPRVCRLENAVKSKTHNVDPVVGVFASLSACDQNKGV